MPRRSTAAGSPERKPPTVPCQPPANAHARVIDPVIAARGRSAGGRAYYIAATANETVTRSCGESFNAIAVDYDRSRPAYPDELISRACELAGLHDGDRVLELGCGTGQLTSSLVARGLDVTAIEPGEHLIALAQRNLSGAAPVHFVHARFEVAPFPRTTFGRCLRRPRFTGSIRR